MSEKEISSKPEEEKDSNEAPKKGNPVLLSRSYRLIAFLVMVTIEMAINVSSGVLSAASKTIKKQYSMMDVEFGYFGLAQGIGRTFGSIFYTVMVNQISAKWLGGAFSIVKGFVLAAFELTQSKWVLICLRGVIGFVHMPPSTYIPIWIDQYGLRNWKTVQMSFLQALVPVGKVLGFVFVNLFGEERWKFAYDIEGLYLVFCGLFIVFSPIDYFNRKVVLMTDDERPTEYKDEKWMQTSIFNRRASRPGSKGQKLWNDLYTVITNYEFELCNCAKALQNGTQSCIHFWCGDFMINRLGMDGTVKTFVYTIMNISGPAFGFILSPVINKVFGSYETNHAPIVIMVLHLLTISFGLSATLINNVIVFVICMTLFFGLLSLCLAMTNGCLMISINKDLKGMCYSVGNITCMSITGALCPVIYGKVNDIFNPKGIRYAGMLSIMLINGSASLFLLELGRIKCRKEKKNKEDKKEELVDKDNEEGRELEDK
jgi:hypothetical protein